MQRLLDAAADPQAERDALNARQPVGRLVTAADGVAYLASPAAASATGTDLEVDGGLAGLRMPAPTLATAMSITN